MQENTITAPPQIQSEIVAALDVLKKKGYQVTSEKNGDELWLHFQFGEYEQVLKFSQDALQEPGTVEKRIIDDLDI